MTPLIEIQELPEIEALADNPTSNFHVQAKLLLLIQGGLSVRQVAARTGFSPSGVQYWVNRFRRLRLEAFNVDEKKTHISTPKPVSTAALDPAQLERNDSESLNSLDSEPVTGNERISFYAELSLPKNLDRPGIRSGDTLAAAGKKTLLFHFLQMLKNEAGTIAGEDIEALHDMRVATRRMRAAFDVFGNVFNAKTIKPIRKGLRQTGRALGKVRDLDVFTEKANHYLASLPSPQKPDLGPLFQIWQGQRLEARERMISHLESSQYRKFLTEFANFLTDETAGLAEGKYSKKESRNFTHSPGPNYVQPAVPLLVYTRLANVNAYQGMLENASLTQLHALRIELKRLRYTLEFFSEILGSEAGSVIKTIKVLQDHLGDLNDANVACDLLSRILTDWENLHGDIRLIERPNPEPIIAYLAYRANERHHLMVSFSNVWEQFNSPEVRKKLALSIAAL
jgi:CHAD domain-containing protein